MSASDMGMLALFVGAFAVFGGALAWASWMESRPRPKAPRVTMTTADNRKILEKNKLNSIERRQYSIVIQREKATF